MAYQNNIPKPTDALSQSQGDILNNFAAIQQLIDVDHVDFAASNRGQHYRVTFPVQTMAPSFSAGSVGLYNLAYAATSTNELFYNNATGTNYPISASYVNGVNNSGWAYLPSGCIMIWGTASISAGGNLAVLYSPIGSFPGFSVRTAAPQLTRISSSTTTVFVTVANYSNTGFTAYSSTGANGINFTWMTIGK